MFWVPTSATIFTDTKIDSVCCFLHMLLHMLAVSDPDAQLIIFIGYSFCPCIVMLLPKCLQSYSYFPHDWSLTMSHVLEILFTIAFFVIYSLFSLSLVSFTQNIFALFLMQFINCVRHRMHSSSCIRCEWNLNCLLLRYSLLHCQGQHIHLMRYYML